VYSKILYTARDSIRSNIYVNDLLNLNINVNIPAFAYDMVLFLRGKLGQKWKKSKLGTIIG